MKKLFLVAMATSIGCGGGSSSNGGNGPVDPASLDFCLQWANEVCRLAYLCVDSASQDDAFHARFGSSMDNCWQGIEKLCTSNQTGAQTFGPSCGPGKTVNQASSTACTDNLASELCGDWKAAPAGQCEAVCGAATVPSDAGSHSDATSTTETGPAQDPSSGSVATATAYCTTAGNLDCDRSFECDPGGSATQFGNVAGCKGLISSLCNSGDPCPNGYDPTLGASCVAATKAATCQQLMGPAPAVCMSACQ
jgi:hypothetical protein